MLLLNEPQRVGPLQDGFRGRLVEVILHLIIEKMP